MSPLRRRVLFALPALLYMALIFHVSSGPIASPTVNAVPDYFLHGAAFGVLYGLLFLAFHEGLRPRPGRGGFWAPLLVTVLYGISDEYHQSFVPSRDATVIDAASDFIGALASMVMLRCILMVKTVQPLSKTKENSSCESL
jgi:VanZ family protein